MKKIILLTIISLLLASCQGNQVGLTGAQGALIITTPTPDQSTSTPLAPTQVPATASTPTGVPSQVPQAGAVGKIPNFDHIVLMILENEDYGAVIGNSQMPNFNAFAKKYVLLSNYFAVSHPSLPNYIAIMSGDTQNITSDCIKCFISAPNIADLLAAGGKTWKSYEEDMPSPCFIGNSKLYAQKHNPLLYFDSIRQNSTLCSSSMVPLTQLDSDLAANQLPNFSFIMPNLCNSGHDCGQDVADTWIGAMVKKLSASPALGKNSLIVVVYDEGAKENKASCCGLSQAGGQVAAILISPLAKPGYTDHTAYDHYSVLKTILTAWNLPALGKTQDPATAAITAPWLP